MNRILITGGSGLLGTALKEILPEIATKDTVSFYPTKEHVNLLDKTDVDFCFNNFNPTHIIHLAAKVGGLKSNMDYTADYFNENIEMNLNVLNAAKNCKAKLISVLSTCVYPDEKYVTYPLTERQLHLGPPHDSNFGYAYAKRMLEVQSRAYRQQYGCNFITVIPNNLYGPNDNFDLNNGHVIPSLIRKIWEAKINNKPSVEIWGSGKPFREFTYSKDAANIIKILLFNYNDVESVNIGDTAERSIASLAKKIKDELRYEGDLFFNIDKPDGQLRKPSSNQKLLQTGLWKEDDYTIFHYGLKETCKWFVENYPKIRGINGH